jgi:FkbM family methyltransferase
MNKIDSINTQDKESTIKISHPAIGDLYCRNVGEAQGILHEICEDQLYFQSGISVSPGDVILDVGANIGVFSLCAAKQGARVYAFEPIPSTFAVLELNVRLHGLESVVTARNIGLSDRTEKKMMFHYPGATVCDAWTPQDNLFKYMADNWENTLDLFKTADPERYGVIVSLGAKSKQQAAIRDIIESAAASHVQIECEFDTLSGVIAHENIEFIDLLKLDAELADWEILNGVTDKDWERIRQLAMEVHVASDVKPISQFLKDRGFGHVASSELKMGTGCIWATK